jgi:hypothetical protein
LKAADEVKNFEGPCYQRIGHIQMLLKQGLLGTDLRLVHLAA